VENAREGSMSPTTTAATAARPRRRSSPGWAWVERVRGVSISDPWWASEGHRDGSSALFGKKHLTSGGPTSYIGVTVLTRFDRAWRVLAGRQRSIQALGHKF